MNTAGNEIWRSRASLQRLPIIIDLLYGFAIGNGLSDALGSTFNHHDPVALTLLAAATVMACGDWLAYHVHVSPIPYTNVWRLLLDMTFPMIVYLLLLSPTLSQNVLNGAYVSTLLLLYFLGGAIWIWLLRADGIEIDPKLPFYFSVCILLSLLATVIGWCPVIGATGAGWALGADAISVAVIVIWSSYNIRCVKNTMSEPAP